MKSAQRERAVARELFRENLDRWSYRLLPAATSASAGNAISKWLHEVCGACGAFEWVTFSYLAWLIGILAAFHRHVPHAPSYLAIHLCITYAIASLARATPLSNSEALKLLRFWYPLPLYLFFFEELRDFVHAIFPKWIDQWLIDLDFRFTGGVQPSMWFGRFASPALNDFMQFAYMTYFVSLFLLPAILYARREWAAFWTTMTATALANYSVYVIAVLLPTESPYHAFPWLRETPLPGSYPTAVINFIESFARVHGAAFPSAHVAGALVAICAAWRYRRWLFWACLPFFVSMCVATVYGRYHYVADVFAGLIVGALASLAAQRLMRRQRAMPQHGRELP
jgi:membrane-associated phospholipid phosphatase